MKNDNTRGIAGLEVHRLAVSKYVAGRQRGLAFKRVPVREQLVDKGKLLKRVAMTKLAWAAQAR